MKYVYRCRRLVKVVFDESNNPTNPLESTSSKPSVTHIKRLFEDLDESYDDKVSRMTFAIATGDDYLDYVVDDKGTQRFRITSKGVKLITSWTFYINELSGVVNSIVPIAVSVLALLVSVAVAVLK